MKKFPWLSWTIFLMVYASFGWLMGPEQSFLSVFILSQLKLWRLEQGFEQHRYNIEIFLAIVETLGIFVITVFLADTLKIIKIVFRKPFSSNLLTFIYILLWSSLVSVVLTWFSYFTRFFILIAAAILLRIDLQRFNFKHSHITWISCISGLFAFIVGIVAFHIWGINVKTI